MKLCRRSLLGLSILAAAPAFAQKVYVDYDKSVDFDKYETFAWLLSEPSSLMDTDPLMHTRIVNEIELRLAESYTWVESNPDLYVTYHTNEKEEMRLDSNSIGYGYGPGWGWDPYWDPYWDGRFGNWTSTVTTYTRGTLIIDLYDVKEGKAIWRGTAEAVVPRSPRAAEKKIVKAVAKISKKFARDYRKRR